MKNPKYEILKISVKFSTLASIIFLLLFTITEIFWSTKVVFWDILSITFLEWIFLTIILYFVNKHNWRKGKLIIKN